MTTLSDSIPQQSALSGALARSKDNLAYWKRAIRKQANSPYFHIELQYAGVRRKLSLQTSIPEAAARKARAIWWEVRALGWDGWMAKHRPDRMPVAPDNVTVGAFLEAVAKLSDLAPKTRRAYAGALRKITSDIAGLSDCPSKYGCAKAHKAWLARVEGVRLSMLSATNVQTWKRDFLARAGQDPLSQRSAKVSVNTFLRLARSLFSPTILKHIGLELPDPLPFSQVQFEPKQNTKYRSEFDISKLIAAARDELADTEPELFKIFALATFAGLRRREIDLLPWTAFQWGPGTLRIAPTAHFAPKSEDSLADVPLDAQVLALFHGYAARATGEFVIESTEPPRPGMTYNYYRCNDHFDRLIGWLRAHGVRSKKPLHCLRKEFGSQLCHAHGIYAASRGLRHSSIGVTSSFYTDSRARATVGLGHLLEAGKVVEFKEVA